MADLIAYTDLQTYASSAATAVTFTASQQTLATMCCGAASDAIRSSLGNRTFEGQTAAQDRYFTAQRPFGSNLVNLAYWYPWPSVYPSLFSSVTPSPMLEVDDFFLTGQTLGNITVTDVLTTPTVTYTPIQTWPFNAATQGNAYTHLVFAAGTYLPLGSGQLKVNAKWGWVAIPAAIKEAALMQAWRYFKRSEAPFGIAGSDAMNNSMRLLAKLDPDVEEIISAYRRWYAAA